MDTDSFVISVNTKDVIKDFRKLEDIFDFSDLGENYEPFSNRNKKVIGIFKTETPKKVIIDKFVCLRNKMYEFKCRDGSKNNIKVISKSYSKKFQFEECKKCLDGEEYERECENFILRSVNHEMYLQNIKEFIIHLR